MRERALIFAVTACAAVGCTDLPEPRSASTLPAAARQPAAIVAQPRYGWYQTRGDDASQVLVTKLSIPGLPEEVIEEIRIARYVRIDADGLTQFPPEMILGMAYADGGNEKGGFGYGGGVNVVEDDEHDDAIILDVSYYWTTPDQVKGRVDERVPAKIGLPLDVQLPGGCRLQVSWRPVPRS